MFLHVSVILSTGGLPQCMLGCHLSGSRHPLPPGSRHPPGAGTLPSEQCMLGDTANKRAVGILLECILVPNCTHIYTYKNIMNLCHIISRKYLGTYKMLAVP